MEMEKLLGKQRVAQLEIWHFGHQAKPDITLYSATRMWVEYAEYGCGVRVASGSRHFRQWARIGCSTNAARGEFLWSWMSHKHMRKQFFNSQKSSKAFAI
jgi:hypothetical protein